jgi:hypothetical protein
MADPTRIIAPSPEEMAAFSAACQRIGRVAQQAINNMASAFAAAARQMELERRNRPSFTVILPRRFSSLCQWLIAPNPAPNHFGRKRRARRARGGAREQAHKQVKSFRRVLAGGELRSPRRSQPRMITLVKGQSGGKTESLAQWWRKR